jgi:hypothetical protein
LHFQRHRNESVIARDLCGWWCCLYPLNTRTCHLSSQSLAGGNWRLPIHSKMQEGLGRTAEWSQQVEAGKLSPQPDVSATRHRTRGVACPQESSPLSECPRGVSWRDDTLANREYLGGGRQRALGLIKQRAAVKSKKHRKQINGKRNTDGSK